MATSARGIPLAAAALLTIFAVTAAKAQAPAPTSTETTTLPVTQPTTSPTTSTPIGATITQPRAAIPLPNPNLSYNSAMPPQRGFIRAEPFFVYPYAALSTGYISNLLGRRDRDIDSYATVLSTRLDAEVRSRGNRYQLSYAGAYGRYTGSHADDYNNSQFVGRAITQFTTRFDLNANAYYLMSSDPRWSVTRQLSERPDRYNAIGVQGTLGYGARSGPGRLEADFGFTDKTYQNNLEVTRIWDVQSLDIAGRFLYRVAPATRALVELRHTKFDYKIANSPRDSSEQRALLGATWELAAATSGTVKIGYVQKEFKSGAYASFSGVNIESQMRWNPRTYSTVDLVISRAPNDSTGMGTMTNDTYFAGIWNHRWRSYLSTRIIASYLHSDFQGFSRTDKLSNLSIGGYFDLRTWMRLGLEAGHLRRTSSDATLGFTRNTIMLSLGATL